MKDTNHKGNVAEAVIAAEAIKLGIPVLKPLVEHTRYDLGLPGRPWTASGAVQMGAARGDVVT